MPFFDYDYDVTELKAMNNPSNASVIVQMFCGQGDHFNPWKKDHFALLDHFDPLWITSTHDNGMSFSS